MRLKNFYVWEILHLEVDDFKIVKFSSKHLRTCAFGKIAHLKLVLLGNCHLELENCTARKLIYRKLYF